MVYSLCCMKQSVLVAEHFYNRLVKQQIAQLSQRDRAAELVSFGQNNF